MNLPEASLKPRKTAVQARSQATIDALHLATIQVLTREGLRRCTTTRVAERAGMSVGSLYQYYPNRDALLAAVLEKHLESFAVAIEGACHQHRFQTVAVMAAGLVSACIAAKLGNPEESKALYAVAAERGGPELVARVNARVIAAIGHMLSTSTDALFEDPSIMSVMIFNVLAGPIRAALDGHIPAAVEVQLEEQLVRLLTAYLQTYAKSARRHDVEPPGPA